MFESSFWRIIHYFAMHNIGSKEFYESLRFFLPRKILECWEDPGKNEGEDLTDWSIRIHNKYNESKDQYAKWTREDCTIAHPMTCDYKAGKPTPWDVLHYIAVHRSGEALRFLRLFNRLYPDDDCRNRFFIDDPVGMKETLYEWAIRSHKRMNLEFKFDIDHGVVYTSSVPKEPIPESQARLNPPMPVSPYEGIKPDIPITPPEPIEYELSTSQNPMLPTSSFSSLRLNQRP